MVMYSFRLARIDIGETRGKQNTDDYLVTFSAHVDESSRGWGLRGSGAGQFHALTRGASVPTHPAGSPWGVRAHRVDRMTRGWTLGPFELGPRDRVAIAYTGTNVGDSQFRIEQETSDRIILKILDEAASLAVGAISGLLGATAGGLLGHFTRPVEKLLGWEPAERCNGPVFAGVIGYTGAELERLDFGGERASFPGLTFRELAFDHTDVETHDMQACGAVARTRVVVEVARYDRPLSVKLAAIGARSDIDVSRGIRQVAPSTEPISIKQILNVIG